MTKALETHSEFSTRLYDNEKDDLIKLIDSYKGVSLCTSVAEIWVSKPPKHDEFVKLASGFLCFIKDYTKKSYFFRLYSYNTSENADKIMKESWSQEMYIPFNYKILTKNFHYFAADTCNVGLNFAFEDEAESFAEIFIKKYLSKVKRIDAIKPIRKNGLSNFQNQEYFSEKIISTVAFRPLICKQKLSNLVDSTKIYSSIFNYGKLRKKKLNKSSIGSPTEFKVIQHIGKNCNNELECDLKENDVSIRIKEILKELNIKNNRRTQTFLENFIMTHQNEIESKIEDQVSNLGKEQSNLSEINNSAENIKHLRPPSPIIGFNSLNDTNHLFEEKPNQNNNRNIKDEGPLYNQLRSQLEAMRIHLSRLKTFFTFKLMANYVKNLDDSSDEEEESDWDA